MEEVQRFETRYENGYDLLTDERYNRWLEMYHPEDADLLLNQTFMPESPGCELTLLRSHHHPYHQLVVTSTSDVGESCKFHNIVVHSFSL